MTIKITTSDYPQPMTFETDVELPPFKSCCKVRTKILREEMHKQQIKSPCHVYEHYVVEIMEKRSYGEWWGVSS